MKEMMAVGELAKMMGVTVRTLQYYDKEGLLKPSALSEGGRRLYSPKDMVKLHQILSFKFLGFSLEEIRDRIFSMDSPQEVCTVLEQQKKTVERQIETFQQVLKSLDSLYTEVKSMDTVDFNKFAQIIELIRMGNHDYWLWKFFDDTLSEHVCNRFAQSNVHDGVNILKTYNSLVDEALNLKRNDEPADSEKSIMLAEKWWTMVMDFTGGDLSLLPNLMKFNETKTGWDNQMAERQKEVENYVGAILDAYFTQDGAIFPQGE